MTEQPGTVSVDVRMERFRLASQLVFNSYFLGDARAEDGWDAHRRFSRVENVLFDELVLVPLGLATDGYRRRQAGLRVVRRHQEPLPVMLNRHVDSGYWDHPIDSLTSDAVLEFVEFFDWDYTNAARDNIYVRAAIASWPGHEDLVGKHLLVEAAHVTFALAGRKD